jgi:hypothetical protein
VLILLAAGSNQGELLASSCSPSPRTTLATHTLPVGCVCGEQRQSCRNRRWVKIGGKVGIVGIGQYTSPLSTLVAYLRRLREILMLRMTTPPSELLYLSIIHLDGAFIFREMNGESWVNEKRKGIHSLLAWKHMPPDRTCNNQTHKKLAKALTRWKL